MSSQENRPVASAPQPASSNNAPLESPPAYLNPQRLLVWGTVVNFVLIFGGTIYSQITVNSLAKAYQEAQTRIDDSKSKYRDAETAFLHQRDRADKAKGEIEAMVRQFDKLDSQLSELRKEGARKLESIADEARNQLTLLKVERSNIGATMAALSEEARRTIDANKISIQKDVERHVSSAKDELNASRKRLDTLSGDIAALKIAIEAKSNEISALQLTSAQTLQSVRLAEEGLRSDLAKLQRTNQIDVAVAWKNSDTILRSVYVVAFAAAMLSLVLSVFIMFWLRRVSARVPSEA